MDEHKELLYAKLALFKMINQFMYQVTDENGIEYFDNYCESAGESAFSVLGFEDDRISREEFYRRYDELMNELYKINNLPYAGCYLECYLEEKSKKSDKAPFENYKTSFVRLVIDKEDLELLGFNEIPSEIDLKCAIYDAIELAGKEDNKYV